MNTTMIVTTTGAPPHFSTTSIGFGYISSIVYIIYDLILLAAFVMTSFYVYQDLYTEERKSVQHRRKAPKITFEYKVMAYLTIATVFVFLLADIHMVISYFLTSPEQCRIDFILSATDYQIAKCVMYLLFLARLHTIYKPSQYAYSKTCLTLSALWMIIFLIAIICVIVWKWNPQSYLYSDGDAYPNYCESTLEPVSSAMMGLEDLIVSVGFLLAFLIPLKKTMKAANAVSSSITDTKALYKIKYAGTKTVILTSVAMFSTFVLVFLTTALNLNPIIGLDPVLNSICVVLMMPYFPDNRYYQKLCCCCICCCDRRHLSYEHGEKDIDEEMKKQKELNTYEPTVTQVTVTKTNVASQTGSSQPSAAISVSPTSVDTMDQLNVTAQKVNVNDNNEVYEKMGTIDSGNEAGVTPEPQNVNENP